MATMYRILDEHTEVRERRNQLRHPTYQRPELLATGAKQLWVGYHQTARADQGPVLVSVRDPGRVQPLRPRLAHR